MRPPRVFLLGHVLVLLAAAVAPPSHATAAEPAAPAEPAGPSNTEKAAGEPMDPAEACATAKLPPGFRLLPFAAEPAVRNPIGIATDARGRLWVAENMTWAGNGLGTWDDSLRDRLVVLEDADGDGRHDRRTVFWDGGTRLTSVAVGLGGAWVIDLPHLLFIPDRDDDLVPDGPPEIVLDGLDETAVGHTPANGLTWGPDGWLWGRHGIQGTSRIGPPGAGESQRVRINTGVWRYHPARRTVEAVIHGMTNSWGTDFDEHGETFVINTVIGHLWHAVPGLHVERMYGTDIVPDVYDLVPQVADHVHWDTGEQWHEVRNGISDATSAAGGGHAHIGLMIYQGTNWPPEYRGGVFTLNLHGRRINHDRLAARGAGYTAIHAPDLCFIADPFFRGMDLVAGPDGGVFIADWSDTGECHDHDGVHRTSGRIYKLVHGNPAAGGPVSAAPIDVDRLDSAALRRALVSPDAWWNRAAIRAWQRRAVDKAGQVGKHDLSADLAWLRNTARTAAGPAARLRALWALAAIGDLAEGRGDAFLLEVLTDDDPFVRSWGVRLLVDGAAPAGWQPARHVIDRLVETAARDTAPPVQLHLASAVGRLADDQAWRLAAAVAAHHTFAADPLLPKLVWYGLAASTPRRPAEAVRLAKTTPLPQLRRSIARRLAARIEADPAPVRAVLAAAASAPGPHRADLVRGVADGLRGWRQAPAPAGWAALAPRIRGDCPPESRAAVAESMDELDVVFGAGRGLEAVRKLALDGGAAPEARRRAIRTLVSTTPADGAKLLQGLLGDRAVAAEALVGLARYDDPATPRLAVAQTRIYDPDDRAALVDLLASRPAYAAALFDAIEKGTLRADEISAFHARQIADFGDEALTERLGKLWGQVRVSAGEKRELIDRWRRELSPEALAAADRGRGRAIFARDCASCHVLFGAGRKLGPDLTGSNRRNLDYVLENLIDPGASVGQDFRAVTFTLADGRAITGVVSAADDRTLTVETAQSRLVLDRRDIESQTVQKQSLMPDGLLSKLSDAEVRDLVAYLASPDQVPLPRAAGGAN
jgi:putative membrane-bound dehydrogenase-like protein